MATDTPISEEEIVGTYFAPLAQGYAGAFGLADDCAAVALQPGCDLVVTTDAVIEGVHFFAGEAPDAIAWKALAVNVSDLVAKGAEPVAYVMSLALPQTPQHAWLAAFAKGLRRAQETFRCHLVGGDTDRTPGPLGISITALGSVPAGRTVRRSTAQPGDLVYVSGTIGDAALGLDLRRDAALAARCGLGTAERERLDARFRAPLPPIALAPVVRDVAAAAMDISDGLVKDFGRLCRASGAGGRIDAQRVPLSQEVHAAVAAGATTLERLLTGGEDYEVLATVPPQRAAELEQRAAAAGVALTRIGAIEAAAAGVSVVDADGRAMSFSTEGWDHFENGCQSPASPTE